MAFPSPPDILAERDLRVPEIENNSILALRRIYAWMFFARTIDNRILELFRQGLIKGTVTGGQGNEGLIVPLALLADKALDVASFTHRDLAAHLIWSGHLCEHLNQYFANAASPTKAREGNIHHGDPANRSIPMISHLGAMCGPVLGLTDSQRRRGRAAVGFAFFGDGGSSTGDIHEALNLASLLSIPIVFVVENNGYAYSTPTSEQFGPGVELWQRAAGYGIEGVMLDATDPGRAAEVLGAAIGKVRASGRPMLVEARSLRLRGHAAYDTCDYLKPGEADGYAARDPLPRLRERLIGELGQEPVESLEATLGAYIESCVKICLGTERPTAEGMEADLFAPQEKPFPWKPSVSAGGVAQRAGDTERGSAEMASAASPEGMTSAGALEGGRGHNALHPPESLNLAQAINHGLAKILEERPESLVMGQDIATYGGAFKVTEGLLARFGRPRVLNTPLAESACTGYAIGLALGGHRPIEEFQFADFATEAVTQITQNAATLHFRSGAACPIVLRLPTGGGLTFGSFHSQELDSFFLSMPGLKALYPSTPQDAFNAILAAYEDPNPVLLFEHKALYRRGRQPVSWDPNYREVWRPKRVREGDYATFITYGEMTLLAAEACDFLAAEYDAHFDLFDLRCLAPLPLEEIESSLERTGRLVVVHEGRLTHGFGAELVARLTERHFASLKAAPLRIGSLDLPVPFAPELEAVFRPSKDTLIERIAAWMG